MKALALPALIQSVHTQSVRFLWFLEHCHFYMTSFIVPNHGLSLDMYQNRKKSTVAKEGKKNLIHVCYFDALSWYFRRILIIKVLDIQSLNVLIGQNWEKTLLHLVNFPFFSVWASKNGHFLTEWSSKALACL